jgi:CheY-like chemotaxis protein
MTKRDPTERVAKFAGKRVLVVEDEAILAMSAEDILHDLGCVVVGPALSRNEAHQFAAEAALDAAVLDINLGDGDSRSIAETLARRRVPFCFSTGYGMLGALAGFSAVPVLAKPYTSASLEDVLQRILAR